MRETRYSAMLALGYMMVAGLYIIASSHLAADSSRSVEELERVETTKGIIYVLVTGAVVYAGARVMGARMARDAQKLMEREHALVVQERRSLAGLLASSIAHDANNVLMAVLADVEEMREEPSPEALDRLEAAVTRLAALNRRLLQAGRQQLADQRKEVDLAALVRDSIELLRHHAKVARCEIRAPRDGSLPCMVFPVLVHQMVNNLLVNAGEATNGRGVVEVQVRAEGDSVLLEVHDDGPGVPKERRAGLFDALTTTKAEGNGLGLFSVKACATAHGGEVEVGESHLGGACFRVRLPLSSPCPGAPARPA